MTTAAAPAPAKVCFSPFIFLRKNLKDDINVIAMADHLEKDEFSIVGRLADVWDWVDSNSVDGTGLTASDRWIDRRVQCPGFSAAMRSVGWLTGESGALIFPKWDRHNSCTAKARSLEREAKRIRRAHCPTTTGQSTDDASDKRQRQRQSIDREEKKQNLPSSSSSSATADPELAAAKVAEEGDFLRAGEPPAEPLRQLARASRPAVKPPPVEPPPVEPPPVEPPPTEPPPTVELRHTWETITRDLSLCGLNMAEKAASYAKQNNSTPERCAAVLSHWKAHPKAWDIGAIYARFKNPHLCGLPPSEGWPKPSGPAAVELITDDAREKQRDQFAEMNADKARAAESRREVDRLAAQYGPALDKLSAEDLIEYLPTGPARVTLLKHGWRAPTIRARMLRTFVNRQE